VTVKPALDFLRHLDQDSQQDTLTHHRSFVFELDLKHSAINNPNLLILKIFLISFNLLDWLDFTSKTLTIKHTKNTEILFIFIIFLQFQNISLKKKKKLFTKKQLI
jgi:hypothetical protein